MEWSTRPPQGNPEVRKRREPGPGGTRDGDGGLEEIPSLLEAPPEGEERERRGREGSQQRSKLSQLLLPSGLQLPQGSRWLEPAVSQLSRLPPGKHIAYGGYPCHQTQQGRGRE